MRKDRKIKVYVAITHDQKRALIYIAKKSTEDCYRDNFFHDHPNHSIDQISIKKSLLALATDLLKKENYDYTMSSNNTSVEIVGKEIILAKIIAQ